MRERKKSNMDQEIEGTLIQIQSTTIQINSCNSAILGVRTSIIGLELHQLAFCISSSNGISWEKVDFSFYHIFSPGIPRD